MKIITSVEAGLMKLRLQLPINGSMFCATDDGTASVRYFGENHLATLTKLIIILTNQKNSTSFFSTRNVFQTKFRVNFHYCKMANDSFYRHNLNSKLDWKSKFHCHLVNEVSKTKCSRAGKILGFQRKFQAFRFFLAFISFLGFNVRTVARGRLHWTQEYDHEERLHED